MTRSQASVLWPVVKAWGEGEKIQWRCLSGGGGVWTDADAQEANFYSRDFEWRVKPKPREFWVVVNKVTGVPTNVHHVPPTGDSGLFDIIHCIEVTTP